MLSVACRWLARALGRNAPVPGVVTWGGGVGLLVPPRASPNPRPPPPARPGRSPPAAPEQTGGQLCPYAGGGGGVPEPVAGGVADGSPCFARPKSLAIPRIVAGLTENDAVRLVRNGGDSDVGKAPRAAHTAWVGGRPQPGSKAERKRFPEGLF